MVRVAIDPEQVIHIEFDAKVPGPEMRLGRVETTMRYKDYFTERPNVGYETLLYDCMIGDATLFQRADNIESSWRVVQPLLAAWARGEGDVDAYSAGSQGPGSAHDLLARYGRHWLELGG